MTKEDLPHAPSFEESMAFINRQCKSNSITNDTVVKAFAVVNAQTLNRIATALETLIAKLDTLV